LTLSTDIVGLTCSITGFFYVKNFNISSEEVNRQFALGREFYSLPLEEKLRYHNNDDLTSGNYNGYRPAGLRMYARTFYRLLHMLIMLLALATASETTFRCTTSPSLTGITT